MEENLHAKNQLDSSSHFHTIPASDRRTERRTHYDSVYRDSRLMASRGKKLQRCIAHPKLLNIPNIQ